MRLSVLGGLAPGTGTMDDLDLQRLADHLRVLANPNRLELLYKLRRPRSVSEIELTPEEVHEGENPDRTISHQAVRDHLSRLRSQGVVAIERTQEDGHVVDHYVVDHQRLFAVVEELRAVGELEPREPVDAEQTIPARPAGGAASGTGPRLVLVRGQREGRVFELGAAERTGEGAWRVGRRDGLAVSLDYDPFVSAENSEIRAVEDGFAIRDLEASRNGTFVNFEPVGSREPSALEHGDVVSVGKTNLVFRTD